MSRKRAAAFAADCPSGHRVAVPCTAVTFYQLHPVEAWKSWTCPGCGEVNVKWMPEALLGPGNWLIDNGASLVLDPSPDEACDPVRGSTDPLTAEEVSETAGMIRRATTATLLRRARP